MTVYTVDNGELRALDMPFSVREPIRYACRREGPCFGNTPCDQCEAWNPMRLDVDAERERLEARARERASTGPVNENHVRGWKWQFGLQRSRAIIGAKAMDYGGMAVMVREPRLLREATRFEKEAGL